MVSSTPATDVLGGSGQRIPMEYGWRPLQLAALALSAPRPPELASVPFGRVAGPHLGIFVQWTGKAGHLVLGENEAPSV